MPGSYGYDAAFLRQHLRHLTELSNATGAKLLITGDYQGRVMTSTANGDSGTSFGWINYKLIEQGHMQPQFNPVGGEERFWIGPEGGQYSFYFKKGDAFDFSNWQVPPFIDTLPYTIVASEKDRVVFSHSAVLENYSGTRFDIEVSRSVRLLDALSLSEKTGTVLPPNLQWVAYETENIVKNTGSKAWEKEEGLLSVWLLGMFTPSDKTVAIIPFNNTGDVKSHITDNYFGAIPAERLVVKNNVLLLKCDGKYRSKLGLSPAIAQPVAGSFDYEKNILTCILFSVDTTASYVNSKWEMQAEPYKGDVVNAYNDGPLENGDQMGPFYELESSSAAPSLQPGESLVYRQTTCHFEGRYASLNILAQQLLGIDLDDARLP